MTFHGGTLMDHPSFKVLFLCATNDARGILAEAQMNALGRGAFQGFSAGSQPAAGIHPVTLEYLHKVGLPADGPRTKS
jgi:protein-tyrosine-phosphatase